MTNSNLPNVDHIAIAVPKLEDAIPVWAKLVGLDPAKVTVHEVASEKVRIAMIELPNVHIELLEPTSEESPIAKYLEKNPKGGLHHICLKTDDIDADFKRVVEAGFSTLNPEPKTTGPGVKVVFMHPKSTTGVLTELREIKGSGY